LKSARPLVLQEVGTSTWFAFQTGPASFGIFDTFADEDGRKAHLTGEVAKALFAKAEELFAGEPQIRMADLLATK
jgi:quinol monooxygenase YgiN